MDLLERRFGPEFAIGVDVTEYAETNSTVRA